MALHRLSRHWIKPWSGGLLSVRPSRHRVKPADLLLWWCHLRHLRGYATVSLLHAHRLLHHWRRLLLDEGRPFRVLLLRWGHLLLVLRRGLAGLDLRKHPWVDGRKLDLNARHHLRGPSWRHLLHPDGGWRLRCVDSDRHLDVQVGDERAVRPEDDVDDVLAVNEPGFDRWVNLSTVQRESEHERVCTISNLVRLDAGVVLPCHHVGRVMPSATVGPESEPPLEFNADPREAFLGLVGNVADDLRNLASNVRILVGPGRQRGAAFVDAAAAGDVLFGGGLNAGDGRQQPLLHYELLVVANVTLEKPLHIAFRVHFVLDVCVRSLGGCGFKDAREAVRQYK